jgi:hypothetical protein
MLKGSGYRVHRVCPCVTYFPNEQFTLDSQGACGVYRYGHPWPSNRARSFRNGDRRPVTAADLPLRILYSRYSDRHARNGDCHALLAADLLL